MKCPIQGTFFWLADCQEIGEEDCLAEGGNNSWADVEHAEEPTEEDLFSLVKGHYAVSLEKEHYLRTQLWWAGNDRIRWREASGLSQAHLENLRILLNLMDQMDSHEKVIRAELLRELSLFDECLDLLKATKGQDQEEWTGLIRELAEKKNPVVAVVSSGSLSFERGAHDPREKKKCKRSRQPREPQN